jgi:hypothetical protein
LKPPAAEDTRNIMSLVLAEIREIKSVAQETNVQVARMAERVGQVQETAAELETTVLGNGKPGIKNELDNLRHRLEGVEKAHEREKAGRKANLAECRKFKWGMLATAGTFALVSALGAH